MKGARFASILLVKIYRFGPAYFFETLLVQVNQQAAGSARKLL